MTPFSPSMRGVLSAVIALDWPTGRTVAEMAGVAYSTAYHRLSQLRALGLVAWEPGRAGTLRALVTVEAVAS